MDFSALSWLYPGDADRRGLSPLSWSHVRLFGTFRLDMDTHLDLDRGPIEPAAAA